ncbi:MAG: hypothetical protein M1484_01650 [Patescibacteria group bacterium]|nr:hypothetical protein [Patescibacteria group bacterium]MCL5431784.1 hypothetical protein [Patescibacteria group bacterium]
MKIATITIPEGKKFRFPASQSLSVWTQSAKTDRIFLAFLAGWAGPVLVSLLFTVISYASLPNQIPLFYSRVWGNDQLAQRAYIFLPTLGTVLLGVFNLAIAVSFHSKDKVLSYLLAGTAALVSILSTITVFSIINLIA